MYACLAVTCHLHFWQNDRDFLRATVVTRGWNGYRNKSQHRKSTLEKKILPPFQQGFEPATFQSRVRCSKSNHWAIPAPLHTHTHIKGSEECYLLEQKTHSLQIFRVIPSINYIKLQKMTLKVKQQWKTFCSLINGITPTISSYKKWHLKLNNSEKHFVAW